MVVVYGISNCDTVKKAKAWLVANNIDFTFHDYKKLGISSEKLSYWCEQVGWEQVLNRNGLTYKRLSEAEKHGICNQDSAMAYMLKATSSIKRPIIETSKGLLVGFLPDVYQNMFG